MKLSNRSVSLIKSSWALMLFYESLSDVFFFPPPSRLSLVPHRRLKPRFQPTGGRLLQPQDSVFASLPIENLPISQDASSCGRTWGKRCSQLSTEGPGEKKWLLPQRRTGCCSRGTLIKCELHIKNNNQKNVALKALQCSLTMHMLVTFSVVLCPSRNAQELWRCILGDALLCQVLKLRRKQQSDAGEELLSFCQTPTWPLLVWNSCIHQLAGE